MSDIEESIYRLERVKRGMPFRILYPSDIENSIEALKEKAERDKGCEFCDTFDFSSAKATIDKGKYPHVHLSLGYRGFEKAEQFKFCPECGKQITKEEST